MALFHSALARFAAVLGKPLSLLEGVASKRQARADAFVNTSTGLNTARDKRTLTTFQADVKLTPVEAEALFRSNALAARIVELPAQEETREWVRFTSDPKGKFAERVDSLDVRSRVFEARVWARLTGGGVILLGFRDGVSFDRPLDEENLEELEFMTVLDAQWVQPLSWYEDPRQPRFGEPETYQVTLPAANSPVVWHATRVLRFDGVPMTVTQKMANEYWGDSVLQRPLEALRDLVVAFNSTSSLVQDFAQGVFEMEGLEAKMASDSDDLVLQRLQLIDLCRSTLRMLPIDAANEKFSRVATPTAGLSDILDRLGLYLSASVGIPYSLLFGESPKGLNATGEFDAKAFYDSVRASQQRCLRPQVAYLFRLIALCSKYRLKGALKADRVAFDFAPLMTPSIDKFAIAYKAIAEADAIYLDKQVVTPAEVRSRFEGGEWTTQITLGEAEAEDDFVEPEPPPAAPGTPVDGDPAATDTPEPGVGEAADSTGE